jgi:hypothetical protein
MQHLPGVMLPEWAALCASIGPPAKLNRRYKAAFIGRKIVAIYPQSQEQILSRFASQPFFEVQKVATPF